MEQRSASTQSGPATAQRPASAGRSAALPYLAGWISGALMLAGSEGESPLRFHAAQSIVIFLPLTALLCILGFVPRYGWIGACIVAAIGLALWSALMTSALRGEPVRVPLFRDIAVRLIRVLERRAGDPLR
jgi:uncharacterized membrane protein